MNYRRDLVLVCEVDLDTVGTLADEANAHGLVLSEMEGAKDLAAQQTGGPCDEDWAILHRELLST